MLLNIFNTEVLEDFFDTYFAFAGLAIFFILIVIFCLLAIVAFFILCRWKIFVKAGKNGWEALIPIYSSWTYYEISGLPGWVALISLPIFIPYIGTYITDAVLAASLIANLSLAKKFGKKEGFAILLTFVPIIGLPMLAFGNDKYNSVPGEHLNLQK